MISYSKSKNYFRFIFVGLFCVWTSIKATVRLKFVCLAKITPCICEEERLRSC